MQKTIRVVRVGKYFFCDAKRGDFEPYINYIERKYGNEFRIEVVDDEDSIADGNPAMLVFLTRGALSLVKKIICNQYAPIVVVLTVEPEVFEGSKKYPSVSFVSKQDFVMGEVDLASVLQDRLDSVVLN